jgi:hypothetical protein
LHHTGMQTEIGALYGGHVHTHLCREGWAKKKQHEATEAAIALRRSFTAYGEDLERVEVFKYLGRLLAYDDNDSQAMRSNRYLDMGNFVVWIQRG